MSQEKIFENSVLNKNRITCIDGLKGLCAVWVCVFHFILSFCNDGFIGWKCSPEAAADPYSYFFAHFPWSVFTNYYFPLYVFMALIAFIPAVKFFRDKDKKYIVRQALNRYFRFMPMVFAGCLLSVALFRLSLTPYSEYCDFTGNTWVGGGASFERTFGAACREGLFLGFINGTSLLTTLWCLNQLFLGSLLTYAILLAVGGLKHRYAVYLLTALAFYRNPAYIVFVAGIFAADVFCHTAVREKKWLNWFLLLAGIILSVFPSVLLPPWLSQLFLYAAAGFCICLSFPGLFTGSSFFGSRLLRAAGRESFSVIIVHALVLFAVNLKLYMLLAGAGMNKTADILVNFLVFAILTAAASKLFSRMVNPVSDYLCKRISNYYLPDGSAADRSDLVKTEP